MMVFDSYHWSYPEAIPPVSLIGSPGNQIGIDMIDTSNGLRCTEMPSKLLFAIVRIVPAVPYCRNGFAPQSKIGPGVYRPT